MDEKVKQLLEKQQNRFAGARTAVKICTWTKKSLRDELICYKEQFYGIRCHLCCQLSTTVMATRMPNFMDSCFKTVIGRLLFSIC